MIINSAESAAVIK